MKINKVILASLITILVFTGCSNKKEDSYDFWKETILVLEDKLENNSYDQGNWQIGVEDKSMAEDKDYRGITIRQIYNEDENTSKTIMFSLQNRNNQKEISYIYKTNEAEDEKEYEKTLKISTSDESFKQYDVSYSYQENRNGNYFDNKDAKGRLVIEDNNEITYDTMPLMGEAMENYRHLLRDFQKEFNINYKDYTFVNLPEVAKNTDFPTTDSITKETELTITYNSEPHYNAKGYSIITFIEVDKDFISAQFGKYNKEQRGYESNMTVKLEKRSIENCYNILQNDPDISYAVYFTVDTAYLYLQATSDLEIENDVMNQAGSNAEVILKTDNTENEE